MTLDAKKILIALFALALLSGCGGVSSENMVPTITTDPSLKTGKTLRVEDVQGGAEKTNFMTEAYFVNRVLFKDLIKQTLINTKLFTKVSSDQPGDYILETNIVAQYPFGDRHLSAINNLITRYTLKTQDNQEIIWQAVVASRAKVGLVGMGVEYKRALEQAVKGNLSRMAQKMVIYFKTGSHHDDDKAYLEKVAAIKGRSLKFSDFSEGEFNKDRFIQGMAPVSEGEDLFIWRSDELKYDANYKIVIERFGERSLKSSKDFNPEKYASFFNDEMIKLYGSESKFNKSSAGTTLILRGAVVRCDPGDRAIRATLGFGAGSAIGAVVCEAYLPGNPNPLFSAYLESPRFTGPLGGKEEDVLRGVFRHLAVTLTCLLDGALYK